MGNEELAQKRYAEARKIIEDKIQERPEDARYHSSLGIAYAGLGLKEDAIREGKKGVELLPVTEEAIRGLNRIEDLACIYVMVGEYNFAVEQIEYLLSIPGEISIPLLQLDPAWALLRDHPIFEGLTKSNK
jgi:tetratricopeptide (TPR) repeat protein